MGAQTDDRLTQYKKRYKDWEDPNGKMTAETRDCIYFNGCSFVSFRMQPS